MLRLFKIDYFIKNDFRAKNFPVTFPIRMKYLIFSSDYKLDVTLTSNISI